MISVALRSSTSLFQFTPLREGRPKQVASAIVRSVFQFTPLREGRPHGQRGVFALLISIHAPPRGATLTTSAACSPFLFQFTPLREGRLHHAGGRGARQSISIHAPPRGATRSSCTSPPWVMYFNSRPSARGDRQKGRSYGRVNYFNSRPSARGDSKRYAISANLLFNPYKSAWLNNNATQFVEIILVIFHRIIA